MIKEIKELTNGQAYRPSRTAVSEPLSKRFSGEKLMGIRFGYGSIEAVTLTYDRKGNLEVSMPTTETLGSPAKTAEWIRGYANKRSLEYAAVAISGGFEAKRVGTEYINRGSKRLNDIRNAPTEVVDDKSVKDANRIASLVQHPENPRALLYLQGKPSIERYTKMVTDAGLEIARVCNANATVLDYFVSEHYDLPKECNFILATRNDAVYIQVEQSEWKNLRFLFDQDTENMQQCVQEKLLKAIDKDHPTFLIDASGQDVAAVLGNPADEMAGELQNKEQGLTNLYLGCKSHEEILWRAVGDAEGQDQRIVQDLRDTFPIERGYINKGYQKVVFALGSIAIIAMLAGIYYQTSVKLTDKKISELTQRKETLNKNNQEQLMRIKKANEDTGKAIAIGKYLENSKRIQQFVKTSLEPFMDIPVSEAKYSFSKASNQVDIRYVLTTARTDIANRESEQLIDAVSEIGYDVVSVEPRESYGKEGIGLDVLFLSPNLMKGEK